MTNYKSNLHYLRGFKVYSFTNKLNYIIPFFLFFSFVSCKKFVDVEIPKTQLYTQNVFSDNASATAALVSIYSQMEYNAGRPLPYSIPLYTGLSGDELKNYSTYQDLPEIYLNNIQAKNGSIQNIWTAAYNYIYQANSIIEGLSNATNVSSTVKSQLSGEAKLIRSFWYFYLTNLFSDVPIITTIDYKTNSTASRSPKSEVYQQIINDLKDAQSNLNLNYVAIDDTTISSERIRPNKWTAAAMLARIYLYTNKYDSAEMQSSSIINNASLYDTVSINKVFLKNSKETIWQLQPVVPGFNTPEGQNFILLTKPETNTNRCATLSPSLLNSFETGDLRRLYWVGSIISGSTTYYFPFKYKMQSGSTISEYSTVFRLAEQYLIRAEARAFQGNISGAQADLNVIRKRAGLPNTAASDQSTLIDAILHERQVELFTEWGHRWLDLKRVGKIDAVMNMVGPTKGATWNSTKQLYPIPQNERNNDFNLSQNDGY